MKRMICFISGQLLPNYIPIKEPQTRPDVLHAFYTPQNAVMAANWKSLQSVLREEFPHLETHGVEVADEYDALAIKKQCAGLLDAFPEDTWSLNATGGTKLMSSPADELFRERQLAVYYVETPKGRILEVNADWSTKPLPFVETIHVVTYFKLYGKEIAIEEPKTGQEKELLQLLRRLDWTVWSSVKIKNSGRQDDMAEFDAIGIRHYQLSAFECKRLDVTPDAVRAGHVASRELERAKDGILKDLYKLAQVRNSFGGPFGKSYWVFSGKTPLSETNKNRIKDFRISLIPGKEMKDIVKEPGRFGLPALKG